MSKADEMFKKLEYKKINNKDGEYFCGKGDYFNKIYFDYKDKMICIEDSEYEAGAFNMQELQAINEKCKELGWLDE